MIARIVDGKFSSDFFIFIAVQEFEEDLSFQHGTSFS